MAQLVSYNSRAGTPPLPSSCLLAPRPTSNDAAELDKARQAQRERAARACAIHKNRSARWEAQLSRELHWGMKVRGSIDGWEG